MTRTDRISIFILAICLIVIVGVLWAFQPQQEIYIVISLIGSVASTGGLLVAIIQIMAIRKTTEATQVAINSTEQELSILRALESATNRFASKLTIMTNHRNMKKTSIEFSDEDLENISQNIQRIKAYSNKYRTKLQ